MRCPRCQDEYHDHVSACVACGVALVSDDTPLVPPTDAHLGRFHPILATRVLALLSQRRIPYETDPAELPYGLRPSPGVTTTADAPPRRSLEDRPGTPDETSPEPEPEPDGLDVITIRVPTAYRDDLRTELTVTWSDIVHRLPPEAMYTVLRIGGAQPGWFDAPRGAWVDRQGRLQVDPGEEAEREAEAERMFGPSLVLIGLILVIFGFWRGGSAKELVIIAGVGLLASGLFLPR